MTEPKQREESSVFREEASSLWLITLGPLVWAIHFIIVYSATAVVCAKLDGAYMGVLRAGIGGLTIVALCAIGWVAWQSWKQWDYLTDHDYSHEQPTGEHRHEFLGHSAFLLAVLGFIGTIYTSLPAIFIAGCV